MVQKPRGGQSHQQMTVASGKKMGGASQQINNPQSSATNQQKRFKNTTLLGPDGQEIIDNAATQGQATTSSGNTQQTNGSNQ